MHLAIPDSISVTETLKYTASFFRRNQSQIFTTIASIGCIYAIYKIFQQEEKPDTKKNLRRRRKSHSGSTGTVKKAKKKDRSIADEDPDEWLTASSEDEITFSADPNHVPASSRYNRMDKTNTDMQFFRMFNYVYVGAKREQEQESQSSPVVAGRTDAFDPPSANPPVQSPFNDQKTTLERLRKRYESGKLPPCLRESSLAKSFNELKGSARRLTTRAYGWISPSTERAQAALRVVTDYLSPGRVTTSVIDLKEQTSPIHKVPRLGSDSAQPPTETYLTPKKSVKESSPCSNPPFAEGTNN